MDRKKFAELRKAFAGEPVDELLRLLESGDLRTRFVSEMCLRDATGT